jgi:uncharacterized protein (DUF934 family)
MTLLSLPEGTSNMKLISNHEHESGIEVQNVIALSNETDPRSLALEDVDRIDLNFPKFTDGRAFSQAFLLRRRLGFQGEIRATGDVLADQLLQMSRTGFSSAVLRDDQDLKIAQQQLARFGVFYQGDAVQVAPHFSRANA